MDDCTNAADNVIISETQVKATVLPIYNGKEY